ncbi:hypothetical protein [Bosea minatitlanensis]|uniref:Phage tail collar domain-containing protein n=1 Tax=Bosea minatitlanensis TaxID=128782 RepID=A0ABW0F1J2_9HYPH|nr:hypothetical protein [Bosea minatitlanensis]MCT4491683.1 hypothetical protein [Bosea minatitlanensis]
MADERVRIDALPAAVAVLDHEFPAMRAGQTVKLIVYDLVEALGIDVLASALSARLAISANLGDIGDADAALTNLGGTSVGISLFKSPDANSAAVALGLLDYLVRPGDLVIVHGVSARSGTLKANGAAVSRTTYADLDTAIYCGDAANPVAEWGYRCTNPANPTGSRSTTGTHIVLPNYRGEFIRGWDDGRGVDSGRSLWASQSQAIQSHTHGVTDPGHAHNHYQSLGTGGASPPAPGSGSAGGALSGMVLAGFAGISIQSTGGTETRPRNLSPLICIKY